MDVVWAICQVTLIRVPHPFCVVVVSSYLSGHPFEYLIHLYGRGLELSVRSPFRVPHPSVWSWSELSVRSPLRVPHPSVWSTSQLSVSSDPFEYLIHLCGRGLSYLLGHPFEYLIPSVWSWSELSVRSPLRVPHPSTMVVVWAIC